MNAICAGMLLCLIVVAGYLQETADQFGRRSAMTQAAHPRVYRDLFGGLGWSLIRASEVMRLLFVGVVLRYFGWWPALGTLVVLAGFWLLLAGVAERHGNALAAKSMKRGSAIPTGLFGHLRPF